MDLYAQKVAIVTGGASGIGREMCLYLAGHGAQVIIADINLEASEKVAGEIENLGSTCRIRKTDVSKQQDVKKTGRGNPAGKKFSGGFTGYFQA